MPGIAETFQAAVDEDRYEDALELLEQGLKGDLDPETRANWNYNAGFVAWRLQRPDICERHYRDGLAALEGVDAPDLASRLHASLGLVLFDRGQDDAALVEYEKARDVLPDPAGADGRMIDRRIAMLHLDARRFEAADALMGTAPHPDADAEERFAWLNFRLLLAERTGDLDEAQIVATEIREAWAETGHLPEIRRMVGAMIIALRVDAILNGPDAVRDDLDALAALDTVSMSANAVARLDLIRARLAQASGDTDSAIAILDAATTRIIEVYRNLPLDMPVELKQILDEAGRGGEFLARLDTYAEGALSDGSFPVNTVTGEHAGLLVTLLETEGFADSAPELHAATLTRLAEVFLEGLATEDAWRAASVLSKCLGPARTRILFAKLACRGVAEAATSALLFPEARRTYMAARRAPFQRAVALLHGAGRLFEAREIAALAGVLERREMGPATVRRHSETPIGLTGEEAAALSPANLPALIDGSFWSDRPAPARPAPHGACPTLRFLETPDGYIADLSGPGLDLTCEITLPRGILTGHIDTLLTAAEAGRTEDPGARAAAQELHTALLAPLGPALTHLDTLWVQADGVLAALPFELLRARAPLPRLTYLRGTTTGRAPPPGALRTCRFLLGDRALHGTAAERRAIASALSVTEEVLSHQGFSRALEAGCDVLHLSGHFDLNPAQPPLSAISVGEGAPLTLGRVATTLYHAPGPAPALVVLSLCESAAFDPGSAEVSDLPGLFLDAGARTVIATAWKIDDAVAASFAGQFYPALAAGHGPRDAFHAAQEAIGFVGFKVFEQGDTAP